MNLTFVNKFAICDYSEPDNREAISVILEFFADVPVFGSDALTSKTIIQDVNMESIAKLIMSKGCAENLYNALGRLLAHES